MRKNKSTFIAIGIIVLALLLYFVTGKNKGGRKEKFHEFVTATEVQQINISKGTKNLELKFQNGKWFVLDKKFPMILADAEKLISIFDFINEAKILQRVTKQVKTYATFELDPEHAVKLALKMKNSKQLNFELGKSKSYSLQFVRKGEDPFVYLVSKELSLSLDPEPWYYKTVMDYNLSDLDKIIYTTGDKKKINLIYDNNTGNFIVKKLPKKKELKNLDDIKNIFHKITVYEFIPRAKKLKTKKLFDHEFKFKDGSKLTLSVLKEKGKEATSNYLDIHFQTKVKDDKLKYISDLAKNFIFKFSYDKTKLQKNYDDFFQLKKKENKNKKSNKDAKKAFPPLEMMKKKLKDKGK